MSKDEFLGVNSKVYLFIGSIIALAGVYIVAASAGFLTRTPLLFDALPFLYEPEIAYLFGLVLILAGAEMAIMLKHLRRG